MLQWRDSQQFGSHGFELIPNGTEERHTILAAEYSASFTGTDAGGVVGDMKMTDSGDLWICVSTT